MRKDWYFSSRLMLPGEGGVGGEGQDEGGGVEDRLQLPGRQQVAHPQGGEAARAGQRRAQAAQVLRLQGCSSIISVNVCRNHLLVEYTAVQYERVELAGRAGEGVEQGVEAAPPPAVAAAHW